MHFCCCERMVGFRPELPFGLLWSDFAPAAWMRAIRPKVRANQCPAFCGFARSSSLIAGQLLNLQRAGVHEPAPCAILTLRP